MKQYLTLMVFAFFLVGEQTEAADGSSGCGPGWYLFKDNSLVSSSFRSTTNSLLFPVTTIGMTVGTSNCSQHKIVKQEMETLHFATMNYYDLKADMVKGEGSHLAAFTETLGCDMKSNEMLKSELKKNYKAIFPAGTNNPESTVGEIYKTIFRNPELTRQCLNIG